MKARLILFTLLISLLAFALPTVRAGKAVDLSGFSGQHRDVVYENNQLRLKVDGSVGEIIDFSDPSSLNKFTQGENGDYWTIVDGRAKVEKEGVTRLPDGKKYELKITRNTDSLTVKYNVGSEKGYDWFKVKKGNDVILSASGQAEDEKTLVFPEGEYEFTISYEKDECGRSMPDTVELDYIKFGGGSTKTAIVETAFQYGEGAYRWTGVNIDYTGNVTVQLATSFDGENLSNWINYTSGTPALPISRYLHIKLVLSSSGDETLVRGITVTAEPDSKAPEVTFLNLQSQYSSIPKNLQVRLIDPSGIKTGADGSKVEVFKGSRPIPIASEFSITDGGQTVTFKVSVIEEASQLEPGYYTIRVTAVDELGNNNNGSASWTFFLGTDLAIEPGFVIVPSGMKQGFQVSASVDGNRARLSAADLADPNQFSYFGKADFGSFSKQQGSDTILLSTTSGKTGVGTLTVTVAGLTAKARVSTGTGMVARIQDNSFQGKPVTVYTPGGIKIAELPPQRDICIWDGLADYGVHAGKQGLPGIYLFKAEGAKDTKETLAQEARKENINLEINIADGKISASSNSFASGDIIFASAYVKDDTTTRWLGTEIVEVITQGPVAFEWNLNGLSDGTAYVRLVTAGGQSEEKSQSLPTNQFGGEGIMARAASIERFNKAGQLLEDSNWIYHYNEAGQLFAKEGQGIYEGTYCTYNYDPEGRLVRETVNGTLLREYGYDGDGRKVREKVISEDQVKTIFYVYDKDERLAYQKIVITKDEQVVEEYEIPYPQREGEL